MVLFPSTLGSRLYPACRRVWFSSSSFVAAVSKKPDGRKRRLLPPPEDVSSLPPIQRWSEYIPLLGKTGRVSVANDHTAEKAARRMIPQGSNKIVIEAFPGPGQLSRALLRLPEVKKLIILENAPELLDYLTPLEKLDPRVKVIACDPASWASYASLEESGHLEGLEVHGWEDVHPQLHYVTHIPSSVQGEQLVSQFLRLIPERSWIFKWGRVPMSFVMSDHVWQRLSPPTLGIKCKLSVIADAVAQREEVLPLSETELTEAHFFPSKGPIAKRKGSSFRFVSLVPRGDQVIASDGMIEKWDYCIRRLYVKKATPLRLALPVLGPGADTLAAKLDSPDLPESRRVNLDKNVVDLDVRDWQLIVKVFDEWPFAPEHLGIGFTVDETTELSYHRR